jgi:hypothetical protein
MAGLPMQMYPNLRYGVLQAGVDGGVAPAPRRNAFEIMVASQGVAQADTVTSKTVGELLTDLYIGERNKFRNLANATLASLVPYSNKDNKKKT